jgi:Pentapeptide repeats (8 copies)
MNKLNRERLGRITARYASRAAQGWSETESDAAFLAGFVRARDEVLRPVMEEIGAQLRATGYDFSTTCGGADASPVVDFHVIIPGRGESKDTIQFFAHKDAVRGWQVVAEIELKRSPMELARFEATEEMTRDAIEQLLVDAVEQLFASTTGAPRNAPLPTVPAPAAPRAPARREMPSTDGASRLPAESPAGVRALVFERLRAGRVLHGLDLVGADLHGLDLTGALLSALDLRRANLQGCVLTGAHLTAARLEGADLTDAILVRAELSRANLSQAILVRARLDDAVLVDTLGVPPEPLEQVSVEQAPVLARVPTGEVPVRQIGRGPAHDQPLGLPPPPLPDGSEMRWARWAGVQGASETAEVNAAMFREAALPFAEGPPAPAFFAEADTAHAKPRDPRSSTSGHETMALPVITLQREKDERAADAHDEPGPARAERGAPIDPAPVLGQLAPSRSSFAGTSLALDIPRGEALPFAKGASEGFASPVALPRVNRAPAHLSGTVSALDPPVGPALPFAKGTSRSPEPPAALPRVNRAPAHLSGTVSALDPPVGPALPFDRSASSEPPPMTLEEYATLRAHLTVQGEEDPAIWKQFGIASRAIKEALQARFAARFREDPDAQARFVELVRRMVDELRARSRRG